MANDKLGNMLKFTEYDHLQPKQKPTSRTEIGGFAVLEGLSVKELMKLAAKKTGMDKKELEKLSPKKLKKLIGYKKEKKVKDDGDDDEKVEKKVKVVDKDDDKDEKVEKKDESYLFEKKASAKQKAARSKFMEMIQSKKKGKTEEKVEKKDESYLFEKKASAKQKAARAKFMEMIQSKKKGKSEGEDKPEPKKGFPFTKKK